MSATGGGPQNRPGENPFSYLAGNYGEIVEFLEELSEQWSSQGLVAVSQDIVEMPPEERFTESFSKFATIYGIDETANLQGIEREALGDDFLPLIDNFPEDLAFRVVMRFLKGEVEDSVDTLYNRLVSEEGDEVSNLVLAVFLEKYYMTLELMEQDYYQNVFRDDLVKLGSIFAALTSHLVLIAKGERDQIGEDLLRDILRTDYYIDRLSQERPDYNPDELSLDEVKNRVIQQGSISAYQRLDITVSRGAELADLPLSEFERLLVNNGILINYGPKNAEELMEGSGLSKQG